MADPIGGVSEQCHSGFDSALDEHIRAVIHYDGAALRLLAQRNAKTAKCTAKEPSFGEQRMGRTNP